MRILYGLDAGAVVTDTSGNVLTNITGVVYNARIGGVQVTDLQTVAGVATSTVTTDSRGRIGCFAPDGYIGPLWADFGDGNRWLILPSDIAAIALAIVQQNALLPSQLGAANGVARLDATANVPATELGNVQVAVTPDASATTKGLIRLAGDLAGTADLPAVVWTNAPAGSGGTSGGSTTTLDVDVHTGDYTLALANAGRIQEFSGSAAITLTVPANSAVAFPIGTVIPLRQYGAGQVTVVGSSGVAVLARGSATKIAGQYGEAVLTKRANGTIAAPTWHDGAAATPANVAAHSVTIPADLNPGAGMLLAYFWTNTSTGGAPIPAGWIQIGPDVVNGAYTGRYLRRVCQPSDPGSVITLTFPIINKPVVLLGTWDGTYGQAASDNFINAFATATDAAQQAHICPAVTPTVANTKLVHIAADKSTALSSPWTVPTGETLREAEYNTGGGAVTGCLTARNATPAANVSTGTTTLTGSAVANLGIMFTAALAPGASNDEWILSGDIV